MQEAHLLVAAVTLLALLVYIWMGLRVAGARRTAGIAPPQMTGDDKLERNLRVQGNTLEWLPVFLVSMWLFAIYWNDLVAAALGAVWILGRIAYAIGYVSDPKNRLPGFGLQTLAALTLLLGALGRVIYVMATVGV